MAWVSTSHHPAALAFAPPLQTYKQLSKARLSLLVVCTAGAGFVAGSGERIDWPKLGWTMLGTLGAASAANTLNQLWEVSNDALMKRTMRRPLPSGAIGTAHAFAFAAAVGLGGIGILAWQVGQFGARCCTRVVLPLHAVLPCDRCKPYPCLCSLVPCAPSLNHQHCLWLFKQQQTSFALCRRPTR